MQFLLRLMVNFIAFHGSFREFPCDILPLDFSKDLFLVLYTYVVTLRIPNYHSLYALEQDPSPGLNTIKAIQFAS